MKKGRRTSSLFIAVLTSLAVSACATIPAETDLRKSLKDSAKAYWELRMKDKYEDAYQMEYREKLPSFREYINKAMAIKNINVIAHTIKDIDIAGNKGEVKIDFSFKIQTNTKPFSQVIKDEWIYENRRWQHRLND